MLLEEWRPVVIEKGGVLYDYTGLYEVSNKEGKVRNVKTGKVLKQNKNGAYSQVILSKQGKRKCFSVHRLVATAFIPNPDGLSLVNHIDENPSNNSVDNLEWCTYKYNANHGTVKQRITETKKGERNPFYGKKHTEETKRKIRETNKKTWSKKKIKKQ